MKITITGPALFAKPLAVKRALTQSALLVESSAKLNCPVETGTLRRSITHEFISEDTIQVGTNMDYASYVEYGTGLFAEAGDGRQDVPWRYQDADGNWHTTSGQHPQPFIRPALEDNKKNIIDIFNEQINKYTGG